jgi:hypothetical protein
MTGLTVRERYDAGLPAETEEERRLYREYRACSGRANPVALADVLSTAAQSLNYAEAGDTARAAFSLADAGCRAGEAFPEGSAEAAALTVILGAAGEAVRSVTA